MMYHTILNIYKIGSMKFNLLFTLMDICMDIGAFVRKMVLLMLSKHHQLTILEKQANTAISKQRIIVENFFGRMTNLFKFSKQIYQSSNDRYIPLTKLIMGLTNFDILNSPLKAGQAASTIAGREEYDFTWLLLNNPYEE
ncbi:Conserved_hypothetical protein [Hexamita inflata]|uniref:DDE Tnp4 domain-containing protein n=1 Tax=Hexamita inflata TaxID=28002 RepID=A0AA86TZC9_9EUKA|nr:Conserved hypothetical protein [Hexamita inflata]